MMTYTVSLLDADDVVLATATRQVFGINGTIVKRLVQQLQSLNPELAWARIAVTIEPVV